MIHYSCDRCHRTIDPEHEIRYAIRIEIQAAIDPIENEMDDDRDHLVELQDILEQLDDHEFAELSESAYQRRRYDLCSDCHRQYVNNPLSTEAPANLEFSDN